MYKKFLRFFTIILSIFLIIPCFTVFANEEISSEKVIYLTFDDGPSTNTDKILDILKEENVPGTFFLVGNQVNDYKNIILRLKEDNHSLGLHSYDHERSKLYSSKEAFLNEMLETQKVIEDITGEKYTILRFPFGSNNSTFKLKDSWVKLLHDNSLKMYDWTQDTKDGMDVNSPPSSIFKNSISKDSNVVLLMHCAEANKNSVKALPQIIKYYKSQGYTFKKITPETPEIYKVLKK